jgi:malonyl CoA-acyl carrier protein transacylase
MKAYIFPGQGSQFKGMGAELFEEFADYIEKADAILGYSVKELPDYPQTSASFNSLYGMGGVLIAT